MSAMMEAISMPIPQGSFHGTLLKRFELSSPRERFDAQNPVKLFLKKMSIPKRRMIGDGT
jgi:hypothetical protein